MSILDKLANAARAIPGAENYADAVKAAAHTPTARLDAAQAGPSREGARDEGIQRNTARGSRAA